jgi:hypothetical protein
MPTSSNIRSWRVVVGLAAAATACGGGTEEPIGELEMRIVRGQPSSADQDWVVQIVWGRFLDWCAASVVAPRLLLTARRCLYDTALVRDSVAQCDEEGRSIPAISMRQPSDFTIYLGDQRPIDPAPARAMAFHSPAEVDLCKNDLALIELDSDLPFEPMPLRLDSPPVVGEAGTMVGWGTTQSGGLTPDQRQQRNVTITDVGPITYAAPGGRARFAETSMFVATEGGCRGDGGAPFLSSEGAIIGVQHDIGTVEAGAPTAATAPGKCLGAVTVFQRLDVPQGWIRSVFRQMGAAPRLESRGPPAPIGAACGDGDDCASGLCVRAALSSFCSVHCEREACPDGMSCVGTGAAQSCVPSAVENVAASEAPACNAARSPRGSRSNTAAACLIAAILAALGWRSRQAARSPASSENRASP